MADSSIGVSEDLKKILDDIKTYPRETYEDTISLLIRNNKLYRKFIDSLGLGMKFENFFAKELKGIQNGNKKSETES